MALGGGGPLYLKETAGIEIVSHVVELAAAKAPYGVYPNPQAEERLATIDVELREPEAAAENQLLERACSAPVTRWTSRTAGTTSIAARRDRTSDQVADLRPQRSGSPAGIELSSKA